MLRRVRTRTGESIVEEMTDLYRDYGVTAFMFYDDELNVNKQMLRLMEQIRNAQERLGVEWRLRGSSRPSSSPRAGGRDVLPRLPVDSRRLRIGLAAHSREHQQRATRGENDRCRQIARKHGLKVKALMSIGHPGESRETVDDTRRWLLEVRPDDFDVTIITTYPGTPYYDQAVQDPSKPDVWIYTNKRNGDRLYGLEVDYTRVAEYYKGDPDGGYKAYVYTDHLSSEELVTLRDHVERDVRTSLGIPFNPAASAIRFEHSMGQFGGALPSHLLKSSTPVSSSQ